MSKFWVILKETYRRNLKSVGFIIMVLLPIFLIGVMTVVSKFINQADEQAKAERISIIVDDSQLLTAIKAAPLHYEMIDAVSIDEANEKLYRDDISGYAVITTAPNHQVTLAFYQKATSNSVSLIPLETVLENYAKFKLTQAIGLTLEQVQSLNQKLVLLKQNQLNSDALKNGKIQIDDADNTKQMVRQIFAYGAVVFVMIFIMNYATVMGQEIATEKGTRMMEVVLSSTTARTHFFGKFFGIICVLLTQIAIYGLLLIPGYFLIADIKTFITQLLPNLDLFSTILDMVIISVIYAILGVFLYVIFSAFLGSIVSRVEDVQKAMTPMSLLGVIGFYLGMFALNAPNTPIVRFGSLFPFFSPFVMPFRLAASTVDTMELTLSIVFTVVFSILLLWFSIVMYQSNILIYSDKGLLKTLKQSVLLWKQEQTKK